VQTRENSGENPLGCALAGTHFCLRLSYFRNNQPDNLPSNGIPTPACISTSQRKMRVAMSLISTMNHRLLVPYNRNNSQMGM
jgi:hypothetical protein